ncbi:hypothetical protein JTB14_012239 [Gonioctena quinquepunctata]|nr:hypothetical protein JTB14_012239 [Gonioctena quinquepunctata]
MIMSENLDRGLVVIGISGVTCGGKTTTATKLCEILPNSKILSQDDYYLEEDDPRHLWIPELNHVNYDILSSLDMDKMYKDILQIISNHKSKASKYNSTSNNIQSDEMIHIPNRKLNDTSFLIVEGFSIFNYKPMLHLFNLKYYFTLDKDECWKRRKTRTYIPPDCPGYFELCAWPEHQSQLEEVKSSVRGLTFVDGNSSDVEVCEQILADIDEYL